MSNKEIRYSILIFLMLLMACNSKNSVNDIYVDYVQKNFKNYEAIYHQLNDNLLAWKTDSLAITKNYFFDNYWQIDSALVFNKNRTRLFTTLNSKSKSIKDATVDTVNEIGGAQINGEWYFFTPISMPVLREKYQDSIYAAFTFEELSYIAHKHRFGNALIRHPDGSFEANANWFSNKFLENLLMLLMNLVKNITSG